MKNAMKIFLFAAVVYMLTGCAGSKIFWTSTPDFKTAENDYYKATVTPVKYEDKYYVSFLLDVNNKSGEELRVDWNRTKYILNGSLYGVFVFKGIIPEDIKNLTIPEDIVAAGRTFSKTISPHRMVAWASRSNSGKGIIPGILPDGENGIYLVLTQKGKEIAERLTVIIKETGE